MKLTDEEIVKDIERSTGMPSYWKKIVLDLIHRLQNNYSNLKEKYVKMLDLNEKTLTKQQAEIERLTKERDKLFNANVDTQEELNKVRLDRNRENTELQKQVNELKAENTELYKEHTALIAGSILAKQNIARDTAKEILQEGKYCLSKSMQEWIKERYGVEVE